MRAPERTWSMNGEPLPDHFVDWTRPTYISRELVIRRLKQLADTDNSMPFDPEARNCEAISLLLGYIADPEITELFNQVPAL